jgi:hypothetical protein
MSTLFAYDCYLDCNAYLENHCPFQGTEFKDYCIVDATFPIWDSGVICHYLLASLSCYIRA